MRSNYWIDLNAWETKRYGNVSTPLDPKGNQAALPKTYMQE